MSGYQLQTNPKKPCVPTCQNEDCKCDTPGTCTFCKDSNADPDTQCQECLPGYYYKNADDEKCSKNKTKPSDTKNKTSTPKRNSTDDEDLDAADTTNSTASGTKKDTKKAQKKPKKTSDNDAGDTDEPNNDNWSAVSVLITKNIWSGMSGLKKRADVNKKEEVFIPGKTKPKGEKEKMPESNRVVLTEHKSLSTKPIESTLKGPAIS